MGNVAKGALAGSVLLTLAALLTACRSEAGAADEDNRSQPAPPVIKMYLSSSSNLPEGMTINRNPWVEWIERENNIQLQIETGPSQPDDYMNKLSRKLASSDIPDVFVIPASYQSWLMNMAKLGLAMKLDDKVDSYANLRSSVYPESWQAVKLEKSIYGIPVLADGNPATDNVYIRKDWLDKLGLAVPNTLEELRGVAAAFRDRDPDGNGKDDTYGLIAYDNFLGWSHLFGAFGVIPGQWIEKNGTLVPADIQPEMKQALGYIRQLHQDNLLDNEWPVTKRSVYAGKVAANRVGVFEGSWASTRSELLASLQSDPQAEWITIAPPAGPEGKRGVFGGEKYKSFVVISRQAKNPEAILKLLDWQARTTVRDQFVFGFGSMGEGVMYSKVDGMNLLNFANHNKYNFRQELMLVQPKELNVAKMAALGPEFRLVDNILLSVSYQIPNAFTGSPTPGMVEQQSSLNKLRDDTFVKIIIGELPLDAFDSFVDRYLQSGGDVIGKEAAAWHAGLTKGETRLGGLP